MVLLVDGKKINLDFGKNKNIRSSPVSEVLRDVSRSVEYMYGMVVMAIE